MQAKISAMVGDPKLVFSHTLKDLDWKSATLAKHNPGQQIAELRQQAGKDIYVDSRSLKIQLLLDSSGSMILYFHPVISEPIAS